jgi:hypothetical protein
MISGMPTSAHETPHGLARLDPSLPDWVQTEVLGDDAPGFDHARLYDPTVRPRTYQADTMVLYCDAADHPVRAAVYEVQRGRDLDKIGTWKLYVGHLESEFRVKASLVVFFPDRAVAGWYHRQIAKDTFSGARLHPRFFTPADVPLVVDEHEAAAHPARVLFSAICHAADTEVDAMFPALLTALDALAPTLKIFYNDQVIGGLPAAARDRWEAFLMTTTLGRRYRTERYNEIDAAAEARGQAHGEAIGQARSVLGVLEARGLPVPDEIREKILACTDLDELDIWLRRAVTVTTAEDITRSQPSTGHS